MLLTFNRSQAAAYKDVKPRADLSVLTTKRLHGHLQESAVDSIPLGDHTYQFRSAWTATHGPGSPSREEGLQGCTVLREYAIQQSPALQRAHWRHFLYLYLLPPPLSWCINWSTACHTSDSLAQSWPFTGNKARVLPACRGNLCVSTSFTSSSPRRKLPRSNLDSRDRFNIPWRTTPEAHHATEWKGILLVPLPLTPHQPWLAALYPSLNRKTCQAKGRFSRCLKLNKSTRRDCVAHVKTLTFTKWTT